MTSFLSMTFSKEIQNAADKFLKNYILVRGLKQTIIHVSQFGKNERLTTLLQARHPNGTIIFVARSRRADFLASYLCENGYRATSIHGARFRNQRQEALQDFTGNRMQILVATTKICIRLRLPSNSIAQIINYDWPANAEQHENLFKFIGKYFFSILSSQQSYCNATFFF